jgi:hypothetical protein
LSTVIHRAHPSTANVFSKLILASPPALVFTNLSQSLKITFRIASALCNSVNGFESCLLNTPAVSLLNEFQTVKRENGPEISNIRLLPVIDGVDILEQYIIHLFNPLVLLNF